MSGRIAFFLLLSISSIGLGQSYQLSSNFKGLREIDALISDEYVFVVGAVSIREETSQILALNRNAQRVEAITIPKIDARFIGFRDSEEAIDLYLNVPNASEERSVAAIRFFKAPRQFSALREIGFKWPDWKATGLISEDGAIILNYSPQSRKLTILQDDGVKFSVEAEFLINEKSIRKLLSARKAVISSNGDFYSGYDQKKFYYRNDKLLVIDDAYDGSETSAIKIVSFDTKTKEVESQVLNLDHRSKDEHNSFLYNDNLFVFTLSNKVIMSNDVFAALDIYDINTLSKKKSFRYNGADEYSLCSGDVYQDEDRFNNLESRTGGIGAKSYQSLSLEANRTSLIAFKMGRGSPFVHVAKVGTFLELRLGTFFPEHYGPSGGAPTPIGRGGFSPAPGGSARVGQSSKFVIGLMDSVELHPVPNQWSLGNSESKKIEWISNSSKIKSGCFATARRNGGVYLIYYDDDNLAIGVEVLN